MNFKTQIIVLLPTVYCLLSSVSFSQKTPKKDDKPVSCQEIDNKQAADLCQKGTNKNTPKIERMKFLEQALEIESDYVEVNFFYAQDRIKTLIYEDKSFAPTEKYWLSIIRTCPQYHSDPYYFLGFIYYEQEKYDSCTKYIKKFIDFYDEDEKKFAKDYDGKLAQAKQMYKYAKVYNELFKHPVPFDPQPVEGVCTTMPEYLPIISPDDQWMLFTRKMPIPKRKDISWDMDGEKEYFMKTERKNGKFDEGKPMLSPFNSGANEGGASLSIDNKHIYFTICKDEGGAQLNCDVYYSEHLGSDWSEIKKIPGINDGIYWDSQPTIAADGKTLYFASDRKGGLGGSDIYVTVRDETGRWSVPQNLGKTINTSGNEKSPFMHSDSQTLYFSSDGLPGLGGYDIFFTRKNEKGEWMEPKNIGYPINDVSNDLGFFVSTDGNLGYFATDSKAKVKNRGAGKYDIYSFELYKEARPDKVALYAGSLKDEKGNRMEGGKVEILDATTKQKIDVVTDSVFGTYAAVINLKKTQDILITVKKDNYAFTSQLVNIKDTTFKKPVKVDFDMKQIEMNQTYPLNNIYYETSSVDLRSESMIVLEKFVEFLKENPSVKIEIHGHTDNVGDDKSNMALSSDRAYTVLELLQKMGVSKEQTVGFKGFGKTNPVVSNDTEEGRAKNRRTEFVIVGVQ